ncbi:N-acetylmuramoyl-L-alanine amidase [Mesobacillus persicus]|uniref:N-acetylmuramoyl-L-alanine amidase n=1 Tax=Mesobacillus persicus TaxID=930146 RepID=A0A1H7WJ83_9BACI|nr:cell wall hydrolase [Mesobacillus persicus]SEM21626.1 N-acetylmuramoyl-L-alanine amidase [Mesobacillus persicus]
MKKLLFLLTLLASFLVASPVFAYTVEKGDTMTKIARENGLTLQELAQANPQIKDLDRIFVGQTVHTPSSIIVEEQKTNNSDKTIIKASAIIEPKAKSENLSISDSDIDLLARIVRAEAQTEPFEGKVAVADVVLNRVESEQFPDTIKEVIYAPGQFQPVQNGEINKPADEESIEAVYVALTDQGEIDHDSLFFYNPDIATSRWLDSRQTTVVIGDHVFKK